MNEKNRIKISNLSDKKIKCKMYSYLVCFITFLIVFLCTPFYLFNENEVYKFAVDHTYLTDENLSFYNYETFKNKEELDLYLDEELVLEIKEAHDSNEILIIKLNGNDNIVRYEDYICIYSDDIEEFNLEYYYANNLLFKDVDISIPTAISGLNELSRRINYHILLPSKIILSFIVESVFFSKWFKYFKEFKNREKSQEI